MIPSWLWAAWLIFIVVTFAVLEGIALVNHRAGDTLSENTRRWIGLYAEHRWVRAAGAGLFAGACFGLVGWFVPHILGG
jgi:hypothetical protein